MSDSRQPDAGAGKTLDAPAIDGLQPAVSSDVALTQAPDHRDPPACAAGGRVSRGLALGQHPARVRHSLAAVERLVPWLRPRSGHRRCLLAGDAPDRAVRNPVAVHHRAAPRGGSVDPPPALPSAAFRRRISPGIPAGPAPNQGRPAGEEGGVARGDMNRSADRG